MQKRFIILIDFSKYSANLISYAYNWSQQSSIQLLLIHNTVVLTPALTDNESEAAITQIANDEALEKLKNLTKKVLPNDVNVQYLVSETDLMLTLTKLLAEPFNNLIFVGLKGTGLLKKIFIGSIAIQVIENSNNIVVALPMRILRFSPNKIYVAVSDRHPLNILELNKLFDFIKGEIKIITFFYLAKYQEDNLAIEKQLKELTHFFESKYNTNYEIYQDEDAFENIKNIINNRTEELLIVQKGSRLLTDQLLRKFLINELVYDGETPLVVLP